MAASIFYNPISHTYEYRTVDGSSKVGIIATVNGLTMLPTSTLYAWIPNAQDPSQGTLYARDNQGVWQITDNATVLSQAWSGITGKPTSTPTAIDAAVTAKHTHTNGDVLAKFSVENGLLYYDGHQLNADGTSIVYPFTSDDLTDGVLTLATAGQPVFMIRDPDGVCYVIGPDTIVDGTCMINLTGMDIVGIWAAFV